MGNVFWENPGMDGGEKNFDPPQNNFLDFGVS
jgi:hypothetical protein